MTTVGVYYSVGDGTDCAEVEMFPRSVADGPDLVVAAIEELVGGPTAAEAEAGASSFFSAETDGILQSVVVDQGLLVVDFTDMREQLSNASTSCGRAALLAQLNATAFQYDMVERIRYEIEGSCDVFAQWVQGECQEFLRSGPSGKGAALADGSGCSPGTDDTIPDGRWFGFVDQADAGRVSLDVACWFSGEAAVAAAEADGEESPPPNDYHIRNDNDRLRSAPVGGQAGVSWLADPGDPATQEDIPYSVWLGVRTNRSFQPGVWLVVKDGLVTSIEEQYVP